MSAFEYTGPHGYKYQLLLEYDHYFLTRVPEDLPNIGQANEYIYLHNSAGVSGIRLTRGYAWDGATMATDSKKFMRASLVHDALYQLMQTGHLSWAFKPMADREMRAIAIQDGFPRWRAWGRYTAVKWFGGKYAG